MLDCQLCWRRCIRAFQFQSSISQPSFQLMYRNRACNPKEQYRSYAIGIAKRRSDSLKPYQRIPQVDAESRRIVRKRMADRTAKAIIITRPSRPTDTDRPSRSSKEKRAKRPDIIDYELLDPKKVADRVLEIVKRDDRLKALRFLRSVPSQVDASAAWNYLIDHAFELGDVVGALKTYNEMKKRRTRPSPWTYSILFSGLATNAKKWPMAAERALKIYELMKQPGAPVKPNQIHINALLHVLSRAGAVEKIFEIVAGLPARGPDTVTYTTIFDGLRQGRRTPLEQYKQTQQTSGLQEDENLPEERVERVPIAEDTVEDATRIWSGVLSRWKNGNLMLDEKLLCSYCRLLLASIRRSHWLQAFTVMEQICGVPKLIAITKGGLEENPRTPTDFDGSSMKLVLPPAPTPSNSTVSLLLEACAQLRDKSAGESYWNYFQEQGLWLDLESYNSYLRFLRKFRAGKEAADLVVSMEQRWAISDNYHPPIPSPKTFYIALSCCKRSKGGRATLYPEAVRILDAFEKMGLVEVRDQKTGKIQKYLGVERKDKLDLSKKKTSDDGVFIAKVYNMFLRTAVVLQDAMVLKQAIRRVTNPVAPLLTATAPHPGNKGPEASLTKKSPNPFLDLRTCLSPSLTSHQNKAATLDLVQSLVKISEGLLEGYVSWGHGERRTLEDNLVLLKEKVKLGLRWKRTTTQSLRRNLQLESSKHKGREVSRGLNRFVGNVGVQHRASIHDIINEDVAENWEPSSRKDSTKKKMRIRKH